MLKGFKSVESISRVQEETNMIHSKSMIYLAYAYLDNYMKTYRILYIYG